MIPVSVIIPSRLDAARADALFRAIRSIRMQQSVQPEIIVVANGQEPQASIAMTLRQCRDIHFIHLPQADLQAARLTGRRAVRAGFFCFLDDDDEYLPQTLVQRISPMLADQAIDAVVGRGLRMEGAHQRMSGRKTALESPAIEELIDHNWLTSCGAVYRSARIGEHFFRDLPQHFEWTYLAFRLCLERRLTFIDHVGHLIHDTPGSLSKSRAYHLAHVGVLERILALPLPADIRLAMRETHGRALHDLADHYRLQHDWGDAWKAHVKSLFTPHGLRFAAYTRKLLRGG